MKIVFDGDIEAPEVSIKLKRTELIDVGNRLISCGEAFSILGDGTIDRFYSEALDELTFELTLIPDLQSVVGVSLENKTIFCRGGREALGKLGKSLMNYFSGSVNTDDHLHIDYYKGSQLLAPTTCHLIISIDE
jgi:hypothetical protein